jgi:excisionase family DNA binding protein
MVLRVVDFQEPIAPTLADTALAKESSRQPIKLLGNQYNQGKQIADFQLRVQAGNEPEEVVVIPVSAFRLLTDILTQMAHGNAVTLMPVNAELTIRQAADVLGVSRLYLINLLEDNKIPYQGIGVHRQICFDDLMAYKQEVDNARLLVLEELTREAQELNMGY